MHGGVVRCAGLHQWDTSRSRITESVELDFMSRLGVYRKRPRTWAMDMGIPVIPTKCVDVNKGDAKQPEYRSRLCGKELKRWDPTMPGTFASMGPPECVMFLFSKALMWKPGANGPSARKIMFLDASRVPCQADATSEMAIELPPEERVQGENIVGEVLKSLYETRKAAHNWKKKWQSVLIEMNIEIGTWSPAIVCCREREVCGFVHGNDFIFVGESMQLAWTESRLNEKLILKTESGSWSRQWQRQDGHDLESFSDLGFVRVSLVARLRSKRIRDTEKS